MKADELREVVIRLGRPAAVLEPADDRNLRLCARVIKLQSVERWNAVLQQANFEDFMGRSMGLFEENK